MTCIIDLTKSHFDRIDFSEATIIDFYSRQVLPEEFDFTLWGATLLLGSNWNHDKSFLSGYEEDMYVSGIGTIRMNGITGGSIEVFAYDNNKDKQNRSVIVKNQDGTELTFKREWGKQDSDCNLKEYLWECAISWPYGFCILKMICSGSVSYEFDINNLVTASAYVKNPELHKFHNKGQS